MRKLLCLLLGLLTVLFVAAASAASFNFDTIHATVDVSEVYTVITAQNVNAKVEWLEKNQTTGDAVAADFLTRGVLFQAWNEANDVCIEVTAIQDSRALQYWDINKVSQDDRKVYRTSHTNGSWFKSSGYSFESGEWKNTENTGRFLYLTYKRGVGDTNYRGLMRRTVRNGYTITVDYQVYGRTLTNADTAAVNAVMGSWKFTSVIAKPENIATSVGADGQTSITPNYINKVNFTSEPPRETNTGSFKVAGTADAGTHMTFVLMRMSQSEATRLEATADTKGKFSVDVKLPSEGVWLMTCVVDMNGYETEQVVFDTTTYQKSLLVVNLDEPLPTVVNSDKTVISGTAMQGTKVQCLCGTYDKSVTVNANGTFKFTIDTYREGTYNFVLAFQKKGYDDRRFSSTATRTYSQADLREHVVAEAVKPNYKTLIEKINSYNGKVLGYKLYATRVQKSGSEWVIFMATTRKNSSYSNMMVVTTEQEPTIAIDSQYMVYGTCTGTYMVEDGDGRASYYPCMELLFMEE